MIEKGKISPLQLAMMFYVSIMVTGILFLPIIGYRFAERDFWIAPILSSVVGFMMVGVMCQLHHYYPKETIIQYSCSILGKVGGRIIGALTLLYVIYIGYMSFWSYASFVNDYFLPQTPKTVILGSLVFVCACAVRGGIEVIGRLAELITPLLLILFSLIFILLVTEMDTRNLFPIFGRGVIPSIKASYFLNLWFSEFMLMGFLLPFLVNQQGGRKWGMISVLSVMFTMVSLNIVILLAFGKAIDGLSVPFSTAVQYINIGDFLAHLESLVMAFWIMGAFIKIAVLLYILSLGIAQWFSLSEYRPLVFPVALLVILLAFWQIPNVATYFAFVTSIGAVGSHLFGILIPVLLLFIAFMKRKKKSKQRVEQST